MNLNKNNLILGLDLDGTLADLTDIKLNLAKEFGYNLAPHQTASEFIKHFIPHEQYKDYQRKLYAELSHLSKKMDHVEKALADLKERGWSFVLASRREPDGQLSAKSWLNNHLNGFIPEEKIYFVENDEGKNHVCRKENIIAFVDDQTGVLKHLDEAILRILIDPFGNWDVNPPDEFTRVKSWHEIPELLTKLE